MQTLFSLFLASVLFLLTGWSGIAVAAPQAEALQPGVHYTPISPAIPRSGTKPEVVEVFNFKCPHCFSLAPHTAEWAEKNKDRFVFKSIPVYWGKQTDLPARAFFAAEFMGKGEAMKMAIFKAQFDHSADIENVEEMIFLAESLGMEAQAFRTNLHSFGVSSRVAQAKTFQQDAKVSSTPTLVINGQYQVQPGLHARSMTEPVDYDKLFMIVETLATQ